METTPDFVVFAADFEVEDVEVSIRASAPKRVLKQLRAKGILS
jgi:hypothetical protein